MVAVTRVEKEITHYVLVHSQRPIEVKRVTPEPSPRLTPKDSKAVQTQDPRFWCPYLRSEFMGDNPSGPGVPQLG